MSGGPLRIGLTGGIGSGKSLVAQAFRKLGAVIVDADVIAREVVAPSGPAYDAVVRVFGPGVLRPDGAIDRKALAARVFADPEARRQLNALTHPHIRRRMAASIEQAVSAPGVEVIILDIPLLLETTEGRDLGLDGIVVVDAADDVRLERIMARDGLSRADAVRRLAAQMLLREKVARADWVIDNNGSPEQTRAQVRTLWEAFRKRRRQP